MHSLEVLIRVCLYDDESNSFRALYGELKIQGHSTN